MRVQVTTHEDTKTVRRYGKGVDNAVDEISNIFSHLNALAAIIKDMRAVKLCSNKILQFLTGVPYNAG